LVKEQLQLRRKSSRTGVFSSEISNFIFHFRGQTLALSVGRAVELESCSRRRPQAASFIPKSYFHREFFSLPLRARPA
jgi:hypothetical protein